MREKQREGAVAAHNPKGAWGVRNASYWNRILKVEKELAK